MRNYPRPPHRYTFVFGPTLGVLAFAGQAQAQADEPAPEAEAEAPAEPAPEPEPAPAPAEAPPEEAPLPAEEPAPAPPQTSAAATASVGINHNAPTTEEAENDAEMPWHKRESWSITAGKGDKQARMTVYGFLQFDAIYDTTRSFPEDIGPRLVARTDTFNGTTGRTTFTAKNTRIGMRLEAPKVKNIKSTLVIEGDFYGNQPGIPHGENEVTEAQFYESQTFRLRHGFVRVETPVVDFIAGQTFDLFAWQNYFFPMTAEFLGIPSMAFSRPLQLKLQREFGKESALGMDVGVAAVRPAQQDSQVPDVRAGLRFKLNKFKGLTTPGNGDPNANPLAIGVSGTLRQFKVDAFTPPPTQSANSVSGWGLSIDALVPVIPVKDVWDRGNALTLTGAFVTGTGIGDLMAATGGATFPTLPNAAQSNPPPEYHGNVDPGMVSFDSQGVLNTIDWQGFRAGVQYYLPPSGRVMIGLNYSQAYSANIADLFPQGGAEIELLGRVADRQRYMDASLFWDATNALRFGVNGSYMTVTYLDGDEPNNIRGRFQVLYFF